MKRMVIVIAAVMLLNTLSISSQQVAASYEFEQALQQLLRAEGWSLAEIQKLLEEEVDWEQARIRDAQVIAICSTNTSFPKSISSGNNARSFDTNVRTVYVLAYQPFKFDPLTRDIITSNFQYIMLVLCRFDLIVLVFTRQGSYSSG